MQPKHRHILIVDDDSDDRELFMEALHEVDESVLCTYATNGQNALKVLKDPAFNRPDYIFLDLNMPLMDGKQCLVQLKKLPVIRKIPVIIFTTSSMIEDELEVQKLGASLFFTKPDFFGELVERVKFILSAVPSV
jgi:CheY-like chemotaxis protein